LGYIHGRSTTHLWSPSFRYNRHHLPYRCCTTGYRCQSDCRNHSADSAGSIMGRNSSRISRLLPPLLLFFLLLLLHTTPQCGKLTLSKM
jgi:hypothetical protein